MKELVKIEVVQDAYGNPCKTAAFVEGGTYKLPANFLKSASAELAFTVKKNSHKTVVLDVYEKYAGTTTIHSGVRKALNPGGRGIWTTVGGEKYAIVETFNLSGLSRWCYSTYIDCFTAEPGDLSSFQNASAPTKGAEKKTAEATTAETCEYAPVYYAIDEAMAKLNKELHSFDDYISGTATAKYKKQINYIYSLVNKSADPKKSAYLANIYAKKYANYLNALFAVEALCPSAAIVGPAAMDSSKMAKQDARRGKLAKMWEKLESLESKIEYPRNYEIKRDTIDVSEFDSVCYFDVVANEEANRLQLVNFEEFPTPERRGILKDNGFKWSARFKAWQRQLTENAIAATWRVIEAFGAPEKAEAEETLNDAKTYCLKSDVKAALKGTLFTIRTYDTMASTYSETTPLQVVLGQDKTFKIWFDFKIKSFVYALNGVEVGTVEIGCHRFIKKSYNSCGCTDADLDTVTDALNKCIEEVLEDSKPVTYFVTCERVQATEKQAETEKPAEEEKNSGKSGPISSNTANDSVRYLAREYKYPVGLVFVEDNKAYKVLSCKYRAHDGRCFGVMSEAWYSVGVQDVTATAEGQKAFAEEEARKEEERKEARKSALVEELKAACTMEIAGRHTSTEYEDGGVIIYANLNLWGEGSELIAKNGLLYFIKKYTSNSCGFEVLGGMSAVLTQDLVDKANELLELCGKDERVAVEQKHSQKETPTRPEFVQVLRPEVYARFDGAHIKGLGSRVFTLDFEASKSRIYINLVGGSKPVGYIDAKDGAFYQNYTMEYTENEKLAVTGAFRELCGKIAAEPERAALYDPESVVEWLNVEASQFLTATYAEHDIKTVNEVEEYSKKVEPTKTETSTTEPTTTETTAAESATTETTAATPKKVVSTLPISKSWVMSRAWFIRKAIAAQLGCKVRDVSMSYALRRAWAEAKADAKLDTTVYYATVNGAVVGYAATKSEAQKLAKGGSVAACTLPKAE